MDQKLYDKLSDYAANHEMLTAVCLHRPLNANRDVDDVKKTEDRKGWRYTGENFRVSHNDSLGMGKILERFNNVSIPSSKKELLWLERPEQSRSVLGSFWASMRGYVENWPKGLKLGPENSVISSELLSADNDAEYLAVIEVGKLEIRERIASEAAVPVTVKEPIQTQWGTANDVENPSSDAKT